MGILKISNLHINPYISVELLGENGEGFNTMESRNRCFFIFHALSCSIWTTILSLFHELKFIKLLTKSNGVGVRFNQKPYR